MVQKHDLSPLLDERLLTFNQARHSPALRNLSTGRPASIEKVHRLAQKGVGNPPIRLEAVRLPSGWCTSKEAIRRFIVRLTAANQKGSTSFTTPARRRRQLSQAKRALAVAGVAKPGEDHEGGKL